MVCLTERRLEIFHVVLLLPAAAFTDHAPRESIMITEQELYSIVAKHPNVQAAFDKAVSALTEAARGTARPGLWAKVRVARLTFDYSRALSELLTVYGAATGYRRPGSDLDCIGKIVSMAARNPDRKFNLLMLAGAGVWLDYVTCAEKPAQLTADQANQDELADIEIGESD
jgi:hypothetical protein